MVSPLIHDYNEEIVVESHVAEEEAEFSAYLDIQTEFDDFIPFDEEITRKLNLH